MSAGTCWNCLQAVPGDATTCIYCGVAQRTTPGAPAPATPAPAPSTPSGSGAVATKARPAAAAKAPVPAINPATALEPPFEGRVGGAARKLAAFTVDVTAAVTLAVIAGVATLSWPIAVVVLVEAAIFFAVWEGRTGLTLGNALFGIRTSRVDRPYSPGVARAIVKHVVVGAGAFVLLLGAWAVVATAAMDPQRRGRSWADRAARTWSVTVTRRRAQATDSSVRGAVPAAAVTSTGGGLGSASVKESLAPARSASEASLSMSRTDIAGIAEAAGPVPTVVPAAPGKRDTVEPDAEPAAAQAAEPEAAPEPEAESEVAPPPAKAPAKAAPKAAPKAPADASAKAAPKAAAKAAPKASPKAKQAPPVVPPAPSAPPAAPQAPAPATGTEMLLLSFDTGQRARFPVPAAISIGRRPAAAGADDELLAVEGHGGTVSKTHCRLEFSRGVAVVEDLGSTNGTELLDDDGSVTVATPHVRTEVPDGMRVRIGDRTFTISTLVTDSASGEVEA